MKKILFILTITLIIQLNTNITKAENEIPVQSFEGFVEYNEIQDDLEKDENAIYLDIEERKKISITSPKFHSSETSLFNKSNVNLDIFSSKNSKLEAASLFSTQEYIIAPKSQAYYNKNGNFSYGTTYSSYLDTAEINYTTALFTRYDSRKFALTTAFSKNTGNSYSYYKDKLYIVPEIKLTKRLALVDIFQSDTDLIKQKNELVLRYTPKLRHNYNDLQFEIGAGQSFYNNAYSKSSVKFSTKFKL